MKKHLLSILTIVLAVAGSAFTLATPETKATQDCVWFIYQGPEGSDVDISDLSDPMNYRRATNSEENALCSDEEKLCAICATFGANPNVPVLTTGTQIRADLQSYLGDPTQFFETIKEKP